jgi:hypothetical protein
VNPAVVVLLFAFVALLIYNGGRSHCSVCLKGWAIFAAPERLDHSRRCWRCFRYLCRAPK